MEDHWWCELRTYFPDHFTEKDACDPHHINGGRGGRWDFVSNLLAVSRDAHEWVERYKTDGRILALWIKLQKGEFDAAEWKLASGKFVEGFLWTAEPAHEWVGVYLQKLKDQFNGTPTKDGG